MKLNDVIKENEGYGIYVFINPTSNLFYVGQSTNVIDRITTHIKHSHSDSVLKLMSEDETQCYVLLNKKTIDSIKSISKYDTGTRLDVLEYFTHQFLLEEGLRTLNWPRFKKGLSDMLDKEDVSLFYNTLRTIPRTDLFELGYKSKIVIEKLTSQITTQKRRLKSSHNENQVLKEKLKEEQIDSRQIINDLNYQVKLMQSQLEMFELPTKLLQANQIQETRIDSLVQQEKFFSNMIETLSRKLIELNKENDHLRADLKKRDLEHIDLVKTVKFQSMDHVDIGSLKPFQNGVLEITRESFSVLKSNLLHVQEELSQLGFRSESLTELKESSLTSITHCVLKCNQLLSVLEKDNVYLLIKEAIIIEIIKCVHNVNFSLGEIDGIVNAVNLTTEDSKRYLLNGEMMESHFDELIKKAKYIIEAIEMLNHSLLKPDIGGDNRDRENYISR